MPKKLGCKGRPASQKMKDWLMKMTRKRAKPVETKAKENKR